MTTVDRSLPVMVSKEVKHITDLIKDAGGDDSNFYTSVVVSKVGKKCYAIFTYTKDGTLYQYKATGKNAVECWRAWASKWLELFGPLVPQCNIN